MTTHQFQGPEFAKMCLWGGESIILHSGCDDYPYHYVVEVPPLEGPPYPGGGGEYHPLVAVTTLGTLIIMWLKYYP